MNLLAGALPQFNHAMGLIATEAGVNSGPGGWMPELRGILIIIISVFTLMGSVYLIILTNVGARLGFLITFASLAGWMFLMGCMWWTYGIGLKGPEPTWEAVNGRTILQDTAALVQAGVIENPVEVPADATPVEKATAVQQHLVDEGWKQLDPTATAFGQTSSQAEIYLIDSGAFGPGGFKVVNVFDKGGERYPRLADGKVDQLAFWHKPRYVVVEVAPVVLQRTEPGRAPPVPVIDESRPHQYVFMIRDQGARRQPAGFITVGSLIVFLISVWLLHSRDRRVTRNRAQRAIPASVQTVGQYLPVIALTVLAALFGALSFFASRLLAPRRPSSAKEAPYECGIVPSREPPERFPVTFYVVAMLFIMFDIEIIFIYPYAVDRQFLGSYAFWEMIAFSVVFFLSFVYVVARGALDWGPVNRSRRLDVSVSETRTASSTIRRVGGEGRIEEAA